jgi:mono/diheme cytochrome c family protein
MMDRRLLAPLVLLAAGLVAGCASMRGVFHRSRAERGRKVFVEKGCHGCHTVGAMGTPIAPDLAHIGKAHPRHYLVDWLHDPTAYCPSHMPRVAMSEDDLQALADYLAALR